MSVIDRTDVIQLVPFLILNHVLSRCASQRSAQLSKSLTTQNVPVSAEMIHQKMDVEKDVTGVLRTVHANAQLQCLLVVAQVVKLGVQINAVVFVQMLTRPVNVMHLKYGIHKHVAVVVQLKNRNLPENVQNLSCKYFLITFKI